MTCETCANWTVRRRRVYHNGDEVVTYEAPQGKGHCAILEIDRPPEFHCAAYVEGHDHVVTERIHGAPWEHYRYAPCPDCNGRGSIEGAQMCCQRCAGAAKVRFYDDGYIGDEQTRRHPKEAPAKPPACQNPECGRELEPRWANCPWCGLRTDKPAPTEIVSGFLDGAGGPGADELAKARARNHAAAAAKSIL